MKRGRPAARSGLSELSVASRERAGGGAGRAGQGRAVRAGPGRAEGPVPSSLRQPRAVMRGWRATYPPRRVYVAGSSLITTGGGGDAEPDGRRPGNPATATPRRTHVSSDAVVAASLPTRTESSASSRPHWGLGASGPALLSPPPRPPPPKRAEEEKSRRLELCPLLVVSGIAELATQQLNRTGGRAGRGLGGRG